MLILKLVYKEPFIHCQLITHDNQFLKNLLVLMKLVVYKVKSETNYEETKLILYAECLCWFIRTSFLYGTKQWGCEPTNTMASNSRKG
jgi:hypothetical protein